MNKNPRKILVLVLDNLGDTVMASAVLKPLKRLYPQAQIGVWVKQYAAGLFVDHSQVDHVHVSDPFWDKSPGVGRGSFSGFLGALGEVRRQRYDVAFVLNAEWRRALASAFARIPERIGHARREADSFLTEAIRVPTGQQHFVDDHRQLIEVWAQQGVSLEDCVPRLEVTDREKAEWETWFLKTGFDGRPYEVIHLFSGDEKKNWPLEKWAELLARRRSEKTDTKFVVVCGPGEEQKLAPHAAAFSDPSIVKLISPSLALLKAVLKGARLFVGGDSGPGHVAAALGTPVLSLFGPTHPWRSRPFGRGTLRVLQSEPLADLSVENVNQAVYELC